MTAPPPPPPPTLTPWWFYTSPLPLDDPLSPLPITTSATSSIKHPPRPFSHYDTRALEKAYQSLLISDAPPTESTPKRSRSSSTGVKGFQHGQTHLRHHRAVTEQLEYAEEGKGHDVLNAPIRPGSTGRDDNSISTNISPTTERGIISGLVIRGRTLGRSTTNLIRPDELIAKQLREDERSPPRTMVDNRQRRRSVSPEVNPWTGNPIRTRTSDYSSAGSSPSTTIGSAPRITTNPFIRSLSRRGRSRSPSPAVNGSGMKRRRSSPMSSTSSTGVSPEREVSPPPVKQKEIPVGIQRLHKVLLPSLTMAPIYWSPVHDVSGVCRGTWFYRDTMLPVETDLANRLERGYCEVRAWTEEWNAELESAVQVGREGEEKIRWKLWNVSATETTNTPLGGSRPGTSAGKSEPMDIRGTRRLEYGGSKPNTPARRGVWASYSSSWASASPVSRVGTPPQQGVPIAMIPPSKVMETIPASVASSASSTRSTPESIVDTPPALASAVGSLSAIPNPNDWVIFANAKEAYICRDTMLGFGNRRPLATIKNAGAAGASNVGIRVVRGFDVVEWERLNPKRKITGFGKRENGVATGVTTSSEETHGDEKNTVTDTVKETSVELEDEDAGRQEVSDLILVIHGIGQKLSERVESFHFTHAINSFRRSMNMELRDPAVEPHLRDPSKGMMVLPVNWRTGLSFEDGMGPAQTKKRNNYGLENITLPTIPAVRNLIGDVMLDIPYYLSPKHKHKMIDAVVREANRVYGLWKMHNPRWEEKGGRVHLIAHSLGSAIALDVLSRQPTYIADWRREQELKSSTDVEIKTTLNRGCFGCSRRGTKDSQDLSTTHEGTSSNPSEQNFFDFDTSNLYCAGSPAGFFLLLNGAMLLPRRGRKKLDLPPGVDSDPNLYGDRGTYGCLAVDNIYNIMHYSDPIAYRLNPTVDAEYAENLKIQPIPSATSTLFESIGSTLRSVLPGSASANNNSALPADSVLSPPPPNLTRLPSTIELETHDFTREEFAEKRINLLNENGTMDWYAGSSGGWVLENQYVNMLGAHSSYWESRDFVRFVVAESGRRPGRKSVRADVRAVKVRGAR